MGERTFSLLNPIAFLQTIMTQSVMITDAFCGVQPKCNTRHITRIGLSAGACFESTYREELGLTGPLSVDQYTDLIISLKNKIGGNFSLSTSRSGFVHVVNTQCPFGESVKQVPQLCAMTSSVFGGIAANNFGYAKVALNKCISANDEICDVCIYTDKDKASSVTGDEYHSDHGVTMEKKSSITANTTIHEQMRKVWCNSSQGNARNSSRSLYIVAESEEMRQALEVVETTAPTKASILITGETGCGKELIAKAMHAMSDRWNKKFVAVNCGAIPENLIESHLFGHEKGAFTGAYEVHHGFFERAHAGTLFLDEIDSLPALAQVRLLRVLQEEEFERVGGKQTLMADVRVIAAGSERLEDLVDKGAFRRDLFYRLNVVPIDIPPLRERKDDILPLAEHILKKLSEKYHKGEITISPHVQIKLAVYNWPGNVRELENVLERAYLFTKGGVIKELKIPGAENVSHEDKIALSKINLKKAKKQAADKVEATILHEALKQFNGDVKQIAECLNLTTRAIHMKLSEHQIAPIRYRNALNIQN